MKNRSKSFRGLTCLCVCLCVSARRQVARRQVGAGLILLLVFTFTGRLSAQSCVQPPADLVSWWPGDSNANDIIDGNPGVLQGGATFAPGKVDQGFSLDGVDDFVSVAHNANLNPVTGITIEAWVKITSSGTWDGIYSKDQWQPVVARGHFLAIDPSGKTTLMVSHDAASNSLCLLFGTTSIPLNAFVHVAGTFDGTTAKVYLNGLLDGQINCPGAIQPTTLPAAIGALNSGTPAGFNVHFSGVIDELDVFNRALSAAEIQAIFAAGSGGKCKAVPFAAFTPDVEIKFGPMVNDNEFKVDGLFTLGASSNGINPLTEDVRLRIGVLSTNIPSGSFRSNNGGFRFEGNVGGITLEVKITLLGGKTFEFKAKGTGANLTGTVIPIAIRLDIGNDCGRATLVRGEARSR